MPALPPFISDVFVRVLTGQLPIADFEQWVYRTPELEAHLSADDYLELISIRYPSPDAQADIAWVLERYVDWGELQREELLGLLRTIAARTSPDAVFDALVTCYDWYWRGCRFLEGLGLRFGLEADADYGWGGMRGEWKALPTEEKQAYLMGFYPAVQHEAEQVAGWLTAGLIRFEHQPYSSQEDYIYYTDTRPQALAGVAPEPKSADPGPPAGAPNRKKFRQRRS
ncbi:hypothetical protein [Hymenobacter sp. CRA2]|uniref:hypothetical protein n=1 Tax=Hymenobacter sp. CRA2 TaxID=1955620 RepID=UPI00098F819D|nr:hypothetical protein [Hymenobacter sp. CRA2]OON70835.1 hypothetical protein B0919_02155 [Hymenobacter sp. CRA2]